MVTRAHVPRQIAKAHGCLLHIDGARFGNAMEAIGCSPAEMTWKVRRGRGPPPTPPPARRCLMLVKVRKYYNLYE